MCNIYRCEYEIINMYLLNTTNQGLRLYAIMYRYEYKIINMYLVNTTNQGLRLYATCTDVNMK